MSNPQIIKTKKAGAAVAPKRYVKYSADGVVIQAASATDDIIGVSDLGAAALGDPVDVIMGGFAEVEFGGTVGRGKLTTSDSVGRAVAAAPGTGVNSRTGGVTQIDQASADIGEVLVSFGSIQG